MIAGAKSLYFDEMQQDDVVICTLTAVLEQPTPGLRVSEFMNLPGIPRTTDSVFLPAKHRR